MFGALIKAFTGRAGFMPGLLAILLIALAAAAVILSMPRIEQTLENSAQAVLSEKLAPQDTLVSLRAEGRNLIVEGQFNNAAELSENLKAIEGVRSVTIDVSRVDATRPAVSAPESIEAVDVADTAQMEAPAHAQLEEAASDVAVEDVAMLADAGGDAAMPGAEQAVIPVPEELLTDGDTSIQVLEPQAQPGPDAIASDAAVVADTEDFDQSSLSLRYDGTKLSLSGHLADDQMAQLIAESVANVVPANSVLEINLDGKGKGSPLNWMRAFLNEVADLPDDAQGVIVGSDKAGVEIIPDAMQALSSRGKALDSFPLTESVTENSPDLGDSDTQIPGTAQDLIPEPVQEETNASVEAARETGGEMPGDGAADTGAQVAAKKSENSQAASANTCGAPAAVSPAEYITGLNSRIAEQMQFETGDYAISDALAAELSGLAELMRQNPNLLLRVVGNLDFSTDQRYAEFVGVDRALEVKNYLYLLGIEPLRVYATPLPRDRAYDKRVQLVFYISE